MAIGTIEFIAPVKGLRLERTEVSSSHPTIDKIVLETRDDGSLAIVLYLIDVLDECDATTIARDALDPVLDRLAYDLDVSVGDLFMSGFSLPKDASGSSYSGQKNLLVTWSVEAPDVVPDEQRRRELTERLEQS